MLRLKKTVLLLSFLFILTFSLNLFTGDAQTKKGAGGQRRPAGAQKQPGKKPPQVPVKGVDYKVFDHADPAHREFACETCHNNVDEGFRVTRFPNSHEKGEHACDSCHFRPAFSAYEKGVMCLICHEKPKGTDWKELIDFPDQRDDQFGIILSHARHVGKTPKEEDKALPLDLFLPFNGLSPLNQTIATESGCIECHAKDGKEKKEQNFSSPYHPQCARCHTTVFPTMRDCENCHRIKAPVRTPVTNLFSNFYHDRSHEDDGRPREKKNQDKDLITSKKKLKCQFCHDVDSVVTLLDIQKPLQSRCTVCHNADKGATARALTPDELAKLKADTQTVTEKK